VSGRFGRRCRRLAGAIALLAAASGCGRHGGDSADEAAAGADAGGTPLKVGLVFDVGGKGDQSFNDAAYEGVQRAARELGITVSDFEPGQDADREVGLRKLAARNYDVVIGVGFLFADAIRAVAEDFPDVHFVLVDGRVEGLDNVASLVFREQEGSYLVGAIAALTTRTGKLGFVGGMDVPLIHRFQAGYEAGARHVRPDVEVLVGYAGVRPEAFADPVRGKEIATSQIERGADVVFHAAGVTGLGVIEAAKERGVYAIGVDSDQNHVAPGTMLTSMVKRVDNAIFREIRDVRDGHFHGGILELGLAEDGVGFAVDEYNRDLLPAALLVRVQALRDSIVAGTIQVPSETGRR
jgi:basic membrane protein A and related proteins